MITPRTEPFALFEIAAPRGGGLALCRLPGRAGTLEDDVAAIAAWKPALVLSLTERAEMEALGALDLAPALARHGIGHGLFPIRDFSTPSPQDPQWPLLAPSLHARLDAGGRIVLHCLGGKGRSGMIAARLLVERGMPGAEALARVRAARPGAIETAEQEAWATRP